MPATPAAASVNPPPTIVDLGAHQRAARNGVIGLLVAAVLFCMMGAQVKLLTTHLPPAQLVPVVEVTWARFAFGLVLLGTMACCGFINLRSKRWVALSVRGVMGTAAIVLFFYSITHSELGKGTLLSCTYLIFAPLFSALLAKEMPDRNTVLALAAATVGIVVVTKPDFGHVNIGDAAGLLSGICGGIAITAVRDLRRTEAATTVLFALCLAGTIILGALMALPTVVRPHDVEAPVWPAGVAWWLLLGMAVTSTAGQLLFTWGCRYTSAALGSISSIATVPMSTVAGMVLFGEALEMHMLVGALLIIFGGVFLSLHEAGVARGRAEVAAA